MKKILFGLMFVIFLLIPAVNVCSENVKYYNFSIPSGYDGLVIGSGCDGNAIYNCKDAGNPNAGLRVCLDAFGCGSKVFITAFKNAAHGCVLNGEINATDSFLYKIGTVVGPDCPNKFNKDADDAEWETPPPVCEVTGFPINIRDGAKHEIISDIEIKNPGYNLSFKRIYDSRQLNLPQPLYGKMNGWRHNYDIYYEKISEPIKCIVSLYADEKDVIWNACEAQLQNKNKIILYMPDGKIVFTETSNSSGVYKRAGTTDYIKEEAGKVIAYYRDLIYTFEPNLKSIKDKTGKGVTLEYFENYFEVTDNFGRKITVTRNAESQLITSVTSNVTGVGPVTYNYPGNLYLTSVDRPGLEDAYYGYTDSYPRYLSSQTNYRKEGLSKSVNYWVNGDKKYESGTAAGGVLLETLKYNSDGSVYVKEQGPGRTVYYDNAGRMIREDYGYLGNTVYEYNDSGFLKKKTDRNGKITEYTYDSVNRVKDVITTFEDPLTSDKTITESYTYYDNDNIKTHTDASGVVTYYEYYSDNNIKKITRAGKTTDYTYNSAGLVETVHDSERLSKKYSYDQYGNVTEIKNLITGNSQLFTYDAAGKLLDQTDEAGVKKTYTYDTNFPSKIKTITTDYPDLADETVTYNYSTADNIT